MTISINTNMGALIAQRNLNTTTASLSKTFARLSSGLRVNSSADDAAGLSIATSLTSQIRGSNQAIRNANDAISLIQVGEGSLAETANALQRMRELAVQASNGTLSSSDRADLNLEFLQLMSEIDRIAENTKYNGTVMFMGSFTGKQFQVGHLSGQNISITLNSAKGSHIGIANVSVGGSVGIEAFSAIRKLDNAINSVSDLRAKLGSFQNRFEAIVANLSNTVQNLEASRSRILDADIAEETSNLTRTSILQQAGTAVLAQANQQPQLAIALLSS